MRKVLGFRKEDASERVIGEEGLAWKHYAIGKDKLVPVVELARLEKWCKVKEFKVFNSANKENKLEEAVKTKDLLKAARGWAKKEE